MRVHSLEMTAFGPFADTQVVDFEPLNAAGVFLLTGHTGAGKTSILDAICFGLFGQVPGVRDRAKAYRSQHAPPDLAPRVVLEVTLQGRRMRLTRHPPWSRPSRRARSGRVDQKARAVAEELVGGSWVTRSTRADEVGHLVSRLLGLNRDQFCQVVMLPQGDFQAFLRAGGRERQHILETLFGTQRFQAVERWLAEHRRLQARGCRAHEEQVARVVARVHEACTPATPGLQMHPDLTSAHPDLLRLVRATVEASAVELHDMRDRAQRRATLAKQAVHALDEARTLAMHRERHREARRRHAALMAMMDVVTARETALRLARAAGPLRPLVTIAEDARLAHHTADGERLEACSRCADIPGLRDEDLSGAGEAERLVGRLVSRLSRLEALSEIARECADLSERVAAEEADTTAIVAAVDRLEAVLVALPGRRADLRSQLDRVTEVVRRGADGLERQHGAVQVLSAARQVAQLEAVSETLAAKLRARRESATRATEDWLDARERRLAGMAAELAGMLVDGDACPVCGSESHPAPAQSTELQVSSQEETALLERVTTLRDELVALEVQRAEALAARSEAIARSGGLDVSMAMAQVERADTELRVASAAADDQASLTARLEALEQESESHRSALEAAVTEVARADERVAEWRARLATLQDRIAVEIGDAARLPEALATVREHITRARTLSSAVRTCDETSRALSKAQERLLTALEPTEFDDVDDLLVACLSPTEIATEEALARAHEVELSTWSRVLADPVLVAAAAAPAPNLAALETRADAAEQASAEATALAAAVERRRSRLDVLLVELDGLLTQLEPLRAARNLAEDVAGLCAGSSTDNATRTALSHYVLAARLSHVVAAANQRLDSIGGGRYQLEHTMARGAGDTRGGLGLVVRDTHTDQGRDPATLSGGETFYVSLSLALGLADVVTVEAGGAELSTLFVDEGFGSLDDDTRDEVLDELDALRSGGRSVGLVSHLSELRARCPAQLHVVATSRGSRCLPAPGGSC